AQQARRVLDRIVGFQLSPILWSKVKSGLSAGRVQSVAVRLIVERERAIVDFNATSAFKVTAEFDLGNGVRLSAELKKRIPDEESVHEFLSSCIGAEYKINNLETKPGKKTPSAPFTTSTLQQEASRKLGFSVAQTMRVAQGLYESGRITYMRTDSVNLSEFAVQAAEDMIKNTYGENYHKARRYKNKASGAQEAHEAIRPTYMALSDAGGDRNEKRLYELIWKRTIASQLADAITDKTTATIGISTNSNVLVATGEVLKFDGFLKVYMEGRDEDNDEEDDSGVLPPLNVGQVLSLIDMKARERFSRPPARFTEASLVKKLEELGIGRPSTYAPTISTITRRNYAAKENREGWERKYRVLVLKDDKIDGADHSERTGAEKAKLFPTDLGMLVTDFLIDFFPGVLDYSFTAKVEE
ncbi:MAG: DNA topoisomerase, partial [Bacteroidota bacterium]